MVGTITLGAPQQVTHGTPFACAIQITGASPSVNVTVDLVQTHGTPPMWAGSSTIIAVGPTGSGIGAIVGIVIPTPTSIASAPRRPSGWEQHFNAPSATITSTTPTP